MTHLPLVNPVKVNPYQTSLSLMALTELGTLCLAVNQFKVAAGANPPLQLLQVFCFVAAHPGCLQQDMQKVTGMSESSCSRCGTGIWYLTTTESTSYGSYGSQS